MPRRAISIILATVLCGCILCAGAGCGGSGRFLYSTSADGLDFAVYGSEDGVHRVAVSKDGSKTADLIFSARRQGPYFSADDGLDYGLTVADVDLDGNVDLVAQTSRTESAEKFIFYFGKGGGEFEKNEFLSSKKSPTFNDGTGQISFREDEILLYFEETEYNPAVYTEKHITYRYGRVDGKIALTGADGVIFYSDQDIYCIASYLPDADDESGMTAVSEKWVYPEKIESYGIEPFPPYKGKN